MGNRKGDRQRQERERVMQSHSATLLKTKSLAMPVELASLAIQPCHQPLEVTRRHSVDYTLHSDFKPSTTDGVSSDKQTDSKLSCTYRSPRGAHKLPHAVLYIHRWQ